MSADPLAAVTPVLDACPGDLGVAVSGGGDSMALLLLAARWAAAAGRHVRAVTVDHGLRAEAAAEAAAVARFCADRGIAHDVLGWQGWSGRGNLQDAARQARRQLIGAWAREAGLGAVALGHTLDDQAETVLMRLARGSGVDGLAAMAPVSEAGGVLWLRPMLGLRRAALRDYLTAQGVSWCEDESNRDPTFDRVRARAALPALAPLGLTAERLAATAERMALARAALESDTAALAGRAVTAGPAGDLVLDPEAIAAADREIGLRLVADALVWVSGAAYRPRLARLVPVYEAVAAGRVGAGLTLHGCVLRRWRGEVAVRREPARVTGPAAPEAVWDGRWRRVSGEAPAGHPVVVAAAGEAALTAAPEWRERGWPREALATTPAVWHAGRVGVESGLVAAPFLASGSGWRFERVAARTPGWVRRILR